MIRQLGVVLVVGTVVGCAGVRDRAVDAAMSVKATAQKVAVTVQPAATKIADAGVKVGTGVASVGVKVGTGVGGVAQNGAKLYLEKVGNPKYDKFFDEMILLQAEVTELRSSVEMISISLNEALGGQDLAIGALLAKAREQLARKVTFSVRVTGGGPTLVVMPRDGLELTAQEQKLVEALKQATTQAAMLPLRVKTLVTRVTSMVRRGVALAASAKADFAGPKAALTLPSVIRGIKIARDALETIRADMPVIKQKTEEIVVALTRTGRTG